jgi:hypothetical protein
MNHTIKLTHISQIRQGDTIISKDGMMTTISNTNLSYDPFLGHRINGDCYKLGYELVQKVIFKTL